MEEDFASNIPGTSAPAENDQIPDAISDNDNCHVC